MANLYPFKRDFFTEEIESRVPGLAAAGEFDNIKQGFKYGKTRIVEAVGQALWDRMIAYYNSTFEPGAPGTDPDDLLVLGIQDAMIFFVYAHHFIFLEIMITDEGVTVPKSDTRTSAFKYQTDEAKMVLINDAWVNTDELINFLTANISDYDEWANSAQYTETKNLIYKSYADFNNFVEINNSALFFIKSRHLIRNLSRSELGSRVTNYDEILTQYHDNSIAGNNKARLLIMQEAMANQVMAKATRFFSFDDLPGSVRTRLNVNEFKKDSKEENKRIRMELSEDYLQESNKLYEELEILITEQKSVIAIEADPSLYVDELELPVNVSRPEDKYYNVS